MFRKILIANRGEIALRVVRAARELGVQSVVAYSQADESSLAVLLADEAICIGPAAAAGSYLNVRNLLAAALVGLLVIGWATSGGGAAAVGKLFEKVIDSVIDKV